MLPVLNLYFFYYNNTFIEIVHSICILSNSGVVRDSNDLALKTFTSQARGRVTNESQPMYRAVGCK